MSGGYPISNALTEFYGRLEKAARRSQGSGQRLSSGFSFDETDAAYTRALWRPVGSFPERLVGRQEFGHAVAHRHGSRVFVGLRAGGGLTDWGRGNFRDTVQVATVVLDGRHGSDIEFDYDGREGWTWLAVDAPEDAGACQWCEIEKGGKLLYSGPLEDCERLVARRINFNRISPNGLLVGWATRAEPGDDAPPVERNELFLEARVSWPDGRRRRQVARTEAEWHNNQALRIFRIPSGIGPGELARVEIATLEDQSAERSPVWAFLGEGVGFLLAGPRLEAGALLVTLVGNSPGATAEARVVTERGETLAIDRPDTPPFAYYEKLNTLAIPQELVEEGGRLEIRSAQDTLLGVLPPLGPLLAEAREEAAAAEARRAAQRKAAAEAAEAEARRAAEAAEAAAVRARRIAEEVKATRKA